LDDDEEIMDELIETDPDEAQHHPIVDGNDDELQDTLRSFNQSNQFEQRPNYKT